MLWAGFMGWRLAGQDLTSLGARIVSDEVGVQHFETDSLQLEVGRRVMLRRTVLVSG